MVNGLVPVDALTSELVEAALHVQVIVVLTGVVVTLTFVAGVRREI